jgi:hypothetical protein
VAWGLPGGEARGWFDWRSECARYVAKFNQFVKMLVVYSAEKSASLPFRCHCPGEDQMKKKSIIKHLKDYFDKDFRKKLKKEETLQGVVERLEQKHQKLLGQIEGEDSKDKRKKLQKMVVVLEAQISKARRMLDEEERALNSDNGE